MSQTRIVDLIEPAFVAYLKVLQAAGDLPAALEILPGHGSEQLEDVEVRLIVTAYRPVQVFSSGGNYELSLQFKVLNRAKEVGSSVLHGEVVAALEGILQLSNRAAVLAAINASAEIGLISYVSVDPHEEARADKLHGTVLDYQVEAYFKPAV